MATIIFLMRILHLKCYVELAKVKTEEKMTGGKVGKAQVNEAFQMNPHERGL